MQADNICIVCVCVCMCVCVCVLIPIDWSFGKSNTAPCVYGEKTNVYWNSVWSGSYIAHAWTWLL